MPRRGSILLTFVLEALTDNRYCNLKWLNEEKMIFYLQCVHKSNKDWKKDNGRIFQDWHKLKFRKSEKDSFSDMRQRFVQALKRSRYIQILKNLSHQNTLVYQINHSLVESVSEIELLSPATSIFPSSPDVYQEPSHHSFDSSKSPTIFFNELELESGYGSNAEDNKLEQFASDSDIDIIFNTIEGNSIPSDVQYIEDSKGPPEIKELLENNWNCLEKMEEEPPDVVNEQLLENIISEPIDASSKPLDASILINVPVESFLDILKSTNRAMSVLLMLSIVVLAIKMAAVSDALHIRSMAWRPSQVATSGSHTDALSSPDHHVRRQQHVIEDEDDDEERDPGLTDFDVMDVRKRQDDDYGHMRFGRSGDRGQRYKLFD